MLLEIICSLLLILVVMNLFGSLFRKSPPQPKISEGEKLLLNALHENDFDRFVTIFKEQKFSPNFVTYTSKSLLQLTISYKHSIPFIQFLLEQGADVNYIHRNGRSAVFEACYLGAHEQVDLLIRSGAEISRSYPDMFGMTCIDAACYRRKYAVVVLLLNRGVACSTVRERGALFLQSHNIKLVDDAIERILGFFECTLDSFFERTLDKACLLPLARRCSDSLAHKQLVADLEESEMDNILNNCLRL